MASDGRVVFFFQAEDGIRDLTVTGVQTCALPISSRRSAGEDAGGRLSRRRAAVRGPRARSRGAAGGRGARAHGRGRNLRDRSALGQGRVEPADAERARTRGRRRGRGGGGVEEDTAVLQLQSNFLCRPSLRKKKIRISRC